ncbi:MAG: Dabb family protein [Trebonia sp.]
MIRHTVLFKWTAEATEEQKYQTAAEVAKLPATVACVRAFAAGPDAGLAEGNYDFAVTADFDSEADYLSYRDDPGHRELIQRYIRPILAERVAVQFRF